MKVSICLIRHGMTAGNLKKRYIGATDEALCPEGANALKEREYPTAQAWYVSPMKRCLETAALIGGRPPLTVVQDLRECDFGLFENKNYLELSGCPEYQAWIDSGGTLPFPGGESADEFRDRSCLAFERVLNRVFVRKQEQVSLVVHGGTIMSVMERYAVPHKDYYSWHVENGNGYRIFLEQERWREQKIIEQYTRLFE